MFGVGPARLRPGRGRRRRDDLLRLASESQPPDRRDRAGLRGGPPARHVHRAVVLPAQLGLQGRRHRLPPRRRPDRPGQPPRRDDRGRHHQAEAAGEQRRLHGAQRANGGVRQDAQARLRQADDRQPDRPHPLPGGSTATWAAPALINSRRRVVGRDRPRRGGQDRGHQQARGRHGPDLRPQGLPAPDGRGHRRCSTRSRTSTSRPRSRSPSGVCNGAVRRDRAAVQRWDGVLTRAAASPSCSPSPPAAAVVGRGGAGDAARSAGDGPRRARGRRRHDPRASSTAARSPCATSAIDTPESVKPGRRSSASPRRRARRTRGSSTGGAVRLAPTPSRATATGGCWPTSTARATSCSSTPSWCARGYARPLTIPPNVRHATRFARARSAARASAGRGLWARVLTEYAPARWPCACDRRSRSSSRPSSRRRGPSASAARRCARQAAAARAEARASQRTHKHGSLRFAAAGARPHRDRRPRDRRDVRDALPRDGLAGRGVSRAASGPRRGGELAVDLRRGARRRPSAPRPCRAPPGSRGRPPCGTPGCPAEPGCRCGPSRP